MTGITRPRQQMVPLASANSRGLRWPDTKEQAEREVSALVVVDLFCVAPFGARAYAFGETSCQGDAFCSHRALHFVIFRHYAPIYFLVRDVKKDGESSGRQGESGG